MVNTIVICPDGHMIPESDCLGRTGEHKATILRFEFFKDLNGKSASDFRKELVAVNSQGSFKYELADEFTILSELTTDTVLSLQVKLYDADELVFKSNPHIFNFVDSIDDSGNNTIQSVVDKAKEDYRTVLASSLSAATGDNHSDETWDELNNTVAELPILKDEQTQALGDWDLIKTYFENYTGRGHSLFSSSPSNADGAMSYKLPYIYTPLMIWDRTKNAAFSPKLLEAGVDVTSAQEGSLSGMHFSSPGMQRLTLTGNANASSLQYFMHKASSLVYIKMETPNVEKLRENPSYYYSAFDTCNVLETIDCELDFTNQTNVTDVFRTCFRLKHLRLKPFTLSTSLDLGSCRSLHHNDLGNYDSLISILNGITNDREVAKNMTITFSNEITDFTVGMYQFWMKNVYFREGSNLYYSKLEEVEVGYVYLELTLYEAFINKGVTIAWV